MNDIGSRRYRGPLGFAALASAVVLVVGVKTISGDGSAPSSALASAPPGRATAADAAPSTSPDAAPSAASDPSAAPDPSVSSSSGGVSGSGGASGSGGSSGSDGSTSPSPAAGSGGSSARQTVRGDAIDTRFGPVQVDVVLAGSTIVDVVPVVVPDQDPRDRQINEYAVPLLRQEVLDAQSAKIDSVSGASFTSYGYAWSVQSVLDKLGA
ncbi:FMN-binding protein [Frankia torreyi]|uniref:FMN-binding protein n=1 Tax=Frankia torreyi TaxID=1856 RepID=A0A0D8BDI4_9ACTN|nr:MULTISPECIES: FMN-binding protein [Frankia]KJE22318.1 FMN-binding protein [Frankia torreyi]KQM05114.1 FMN-binding protein [Frankia sp. CpI1-P]